MNDFSFMDDTVKEICKSMRGDPNRWAITALTIRDLAPGGLAYWRDVYSPHIYCVWTGSARERVFSDSQAKMVGAAFKDLQKIKESESQAAIINSFKPKSKQCAEGKSVKWWEFWR